MTDREKNAAAEAHAEKHTMQQTPMQEALQKLSSATSATHLNGGEESLRQATLGSSAAGLSSPSTLIDHESLNNKLMTSALRNTGAYQQATESAAAQALALDRLQEGITPQFSVNYLTAAGLLNKSIYRVSDSLEAAMKTASYYHPTNTSKEYYAALIPKHPAIDSFINASQNSNFTTEQSANIVRRATDSIYTKNDVASYANGLLNTNLTTEKLSDISRNATESIYPTIGEISKEQAARLMMPSMVSQTAADYLKEQEQTAIEAQKTANFQLINDYEKSQQWDLQKPFIDPQVDLFNHITYNRDLDESIQKPYREKVEREIENLELLRRSVEIAEAQITETKEISKEAKSISNHAKDLSEMASTASAESKIESKNATSKSWLAIIISLAALLLTAWPFLKERIDSL